MLWIVGGAIAASLAIIVIVYIAGSRAGRKEERIENLENEVKDAVETKKRINKRRNDSMDAINKRLRKYVRH